MMLKIARTSVLCLLLSSYKKHTYKLLSNFDPVIICREHMVKI